MKLHPEDIPTLPNAITLTGAALAIHGARHIDQPAGVAEIALGRTLDLVDGAVARATGQTSELGAALDANVDKVAGTAMIIAEWRKDIAPKSVLLGIVAQNLTTAVATAVVMKRFPDQNLQVSKAGKYAAFGQNLALGAYATANIMKDRFPRSAQVMRGLGHTAAVFGIGVFGITASRGYVQRARGL